MSVFEPETIGTRIAQARNEKGITQEELGDLVGVATRTVQNHEAGATAPYKHLAAYAAVLNRDVKWFLHGDPEVDETVAELVAELREEVAESRVLLRAIVAVQGLDAERLVRDDRLRREAPQQEDEDLEPPAEAQPRG